MAEVRAALRLAVLLAVGLASAAQGAGRDEAPATRRKPARPTPAASQTVRKKPAAARSVSPAVALETHPDRALFQEAQVARADLKASPRRQARPAEWEKVVMRFRRVGARYPQSAYCDDALLAIGDLYRAMAERFKTPRYDDDAVSAYRSLVAEYPSSRRGEDALFAVFQIARKGGEARRVAEAGREYLDAFPRSERAAEVRVQMRRKAPVQEASLPKPPPPGLAQVFNLRFWSGDSSTRVVIDLERQVTLRSDRIQDPDRLWIDLVGTRLHPNLTDRSFPVGDGLLKQIRVAQNRDDVVRVVLDFKAVKDHSVFFLDSTRLVVDVRGAVRPQVASAETAPVPGEPSPPPPSSDRLPLWTRHMPASPSPEPAASPEPRKAATASIDRWEPSLPTPTASPRLPPAEPRVLVPPQANRAGTYSLARQLGLGARTIVIDAGHGGHDPGTIGAGGLQEKDLVLDVALRLERLVRTQLRAEVIMTRATDVFVPLEERTAIANARGADLFLSVHANSSRNQRSRGVETYFLNFANDPHAEAVAARENAISAATMKDLQKLVKAITLNSKIDESRDFATSVQEAMVASRTVRESDSLDRGVRTAPFYVLIGANMPSVLAEIAFVSNPDEEHRLREGDERDRIAASLFEGVRAYLDSLGHPPSRQLTGRDAESTLASRGGRR